ncbi:DUS1 phosphatase, partial [Asarcornis scutulata]|uniref:Dual specificity protein phosphatase n=5 Tax=Anatidae TaxID=8830 RepID=A0A6J3DNN7_AYTFU|nr:dual specificity protein phosphatase 1 [Anas platyrhynchos]XP_032053086.1 dual specificity protein phosphatase 1 [Aythya fuligula]KAI6076847.1 Dual specificity protein phosphatase 1 [Aix galericulata]NWZ24260.1 DUS1 phosphatase [Asarcornis scutulata]|eukprot:XP_027324342.1 dual specificity protein phosphatase 1 [Anas platyrhynchos]
MVNLRVCALECEALRGLLQERAAQCLVLDCRSFFSFNAAHIRGSCNVRLSTIVRRRAKGALALEHVVPNEELRSRLRQGLVHTVVLLDERSADLELPKRDSTLLLALGTLCREARGARICFLKGGYEAFSAACSELCTKPAAPTGLSLPLSASSAPGSADSGCSSCGTPLYDQGGPVEILPFLYLGSAYHASRKDMLDALGITALINVSANCPNHFEGHYQYKSIPVEDNHKADISSWFNEAIDFIDSVKNDGGRVFVHCQAGISRSATICLAYLMRTNRVKLDEAFEFVKQRRSIISPNFSFMGQLLQFESQVLAPNCSAEAGSPAMSVLDRGASTTTVFNFPVSIPVHTSSSALSYLQSPITTSPSC